MGWLQTLLNFGGGAGARPRTAPAARGECVVVAGREIPLRCVRHPRARRYVLRLTRDGAAQVTVPRGGTAAFAREFAVSKAGWIERQLARRAAAPAAPGPLRPGMTILFRGEGCPLRLAPDGRAAEFADQRVRLRPGEAEDLGPALRRHLWALARAELPGLVLRAAARHGLAVARVDVRNQRSRWGSCSARRVISLNWRLVQTPPPVRDYLVVHELMHLRQMNHSARYWALVAAAFPAWREAEAWLKRHNDLLRGGT